MYRTPAKTDSSNSDEVIAAKTAGTVTKHAGPPSHTVRKSIGDWESGNPSRSSLTPPKEQSTVEPPKPKPVAVRKLSVDVVVSPPRPSSGKTISTVSEARACVISAKMHLKNSRNLKAEIKVGVTEAVDRLFQLVKEAASGRGGLQPQRQKEEEEKEKVETSSSCSKLVPGTGLELEALIGNHMRLIKENSEKMMELQASLEKNGQSSEQQKTQCKNMDLLVGEVRELRKCTEATDRKITSFPSYAEVLAKPPDATSPSKRPRHSIIVSSTIEKDTGDEVLGKVRAALEAKNNGLQLTRVQKVRNQRIVLSCATKEELKKVSEKITATNKHLCVEEAKNKDPLVIIRNLLAFNKDEEIVASLKSQNMSLLGDLRDDEFRAAVKYRRRARNPHENNVVLQVSPKVWQRLTSAKRVHIDLQYAVVQDQSPLVQCTRCLGYGHGRKLCTESVDLCSYCAGPHLRADCPSYLTGETPNCRNCRLAKCQETGHNAFDGECPIRKKWDAIARSSVAYC